MSVPDESCSPYIPNVTFDHPWDPCKECVCTESRSYDKTTVEVDCVTKEECCKFNNIIVFKISLVHILNLSLVLAWAPAMVRLVRVILNLTSSTILIRVAGVIPGTDATPPSFGPGIIYIFYLSSLFSSSLLLFTV